MEKELQTETLQTSRLTLRKFKASDYKSAFNNYLTDAKSTVFMNWQPYDNRLQALWWCAKSRKVRFHWAIVLRETGEVIGAISSRKQGGVFEKGDTPDKTIYDIGYCLGSKWWGQGIMPEAAKAVIDYMMDKVGVNIVISQHNILNPNSGKVMQKIGMQFQKSVWRPNCKNKEILCEHSLYKIEKVSSNNEL